MGNTLQIYTFFFYLNAFCKKNLWERVVKGIFSQILGKKGVDL